MKRIIVSTNENPAYLSCVDIVYAAWKKFVPDAIFTIAFIGNDESKFEFVKQHSDEAIWFKEVEGIPTANHAKVSRMIISQRYIDDTLLFTDIDMIPLQGEFFENIFVEGKDKLIFSGADAPAYQIGSDKGKVPVCYMVGPGDIFAGIANPEKLSDDDLLNSWKNIHIVDTKESVNKKVFSDESLYRILIGKYISENPHVRVMGLKRGWPNGLARDRIDRASWSSKIDEKILSGGYIDCHVLRPYNEYKEEMDVISKYIFN